MWGNNLINSLRLIMNNARLAFAINRFALTKTTMKCCQNSRPNSQLLYPTVLTFHIVESCTENN